MENFRQARSSNERPTEPEQRKGSKVGRLIKAIGFLAAGAAGGGVAVEAGHQLGVLSPEHTAISHTESSELLVMSASKAKVILDLWKENKNEVEASLSSGEDGIAKEFVETMVEAIDKVEEIAEIESAIEDKYEELSAIYAELLLKQQLLEAQGVSFDPDETPIVRTPGALINEQIEIALAQEPPIDPSKQ